MNCCIQTNDIVAKGKNFQSDNFILSIRLKGAEAVRFWAIFDSAKQRNPYAERSDVVRELLGLDAASLLTKDELTFFRTGEKSNIRKADDQKLTPMVLDAPEDKKENKKKAS